MNQEMQVPDLLRSAARLIDRALDQLNLIEAPCRCGRPCFENRDHAQVNEQFAATPGKLREAASRLAKPGPAESTRGYTEAVHENDERRV